MLLRGEPEALREDGLALQQAADDLGLDQAQMTSAAGALTGGMTYNLLFEGAAAQAFTERVAELDGTYNTLRQALQLLSQALRGYAEALSGLQADARRLTQGAAAQGFEVADDGTVTDVGGGPPFAPADPVKRETQRGLYEVEAKAILYLAEDAAATAAAQVEQARALLLEPYHGQPPWKTGLVGKLGYAYTAYTSAATTATVARRQLLRLGDEMAPEIEARWEKTLNAAEEWARKLPGSRHLALDLGEISDGPILGSGLLRDLPVAGLLLTGVQTGQAIRAGADPTEEVAAGVGSTLVTGVATDAGIGVATALGLAGGAPIVIGVGAGVLAAWGVGEGIRAAFHTRLGHDIAQKVDHLVSSGWHKIFG